MDLLDNVKILDNVKDGLKERATDVLRLSENTIRDASQNPEKFRGFLNLWLAPTFRPTFAPARTRRKDPDIQLLDTAVEQAPATPQRMFDLDTGNLVGGLESEETAGRYCVLSHQWKGAEVALDYIDRARAHDSDKIRRAGQSDAKNDVEMAYRLCEHEIEEKAKVVEKLLEEANSAHEAEGGAGRPSRDFNQTLAARIDVSGIKSKVKDAKKAFKKAKDKRATAEKEADAFKVLKIEMENTILGRDSRKDADEKPPEARRAGENPCAEDLKKAEGAFEDAQKKLIDIDEELLNSKKDDIEFFQKNSLLREAVDELLGLLERWRSVIKIKKSMEHAKRIFDEKLFPAGEKRYLWNDTCCINKTDQGELVTSLSLMGDWYTNAEFCLVHLDTKKTEDNLVEEWERFQRRAVAEMEPVLPDPNFKDFGEVCKGQRKPEWATRGWTLQELVMSRSTFYVNSAWEPLSREVENLGPYYYLCPFIELYVGSEAPENLKSLRTFWEKTVRSQSLQSPKVDIKNPSVKAAQNLILILDALELEISGSIERETAIPLISQAVYLAALGMRKEVKKEWASKLQLIHNLSVHLKEDVKSVFPAKEPHGEPEDDARRVIKFLLRCLVAETKDLISDDRKSIARFGNVDTLDSWKGGTERSKFSTQKVMSLASYRNCTVETDRAYSLMGLLGVRCPTFAAEGLSRALARLFDEALISSNDVSVFNWTGRDMGSNIRGRSLYPSSLDAFHDDPGEGRSVALRNLRKLLEEKRSGVMQTFLRVVDMLQDAMKFLKKHDHKHIPLEWISGVIHFVRDADFELLEPQIHQLESILAWIVNKCNAAIANKEKKPTGHSRLSLHKLHRIHSDSVAEIARNPIGSALGLHSPFSRKRSRESDSSPSAKRVKMEDGSQASPTPDPLSDDVYDVSSLEADIERLNPSVNNYLKAKGSPPSGGKGVPELPQDILTEPRKSNVPQVGENKKECPRARGEHDMISPYPIIINSSGIEGTFDIQRVIVTFAEEEKLWDQVESAVSPHQRITGWCGISTGFARVMVGFSCEKRTLEKQLKISQVTKRKVLSDPNSREDGTATETFKKVIHLEEKKKKQKADPEDHAEGERVEHTEEEEKVTRMIKFIEEEDLKLVAGEWVLAKFSDVGGAQWFLCSLELGTTDAFYGHRIPTDKIDFDDAIPEPGLLNVWQEYMKRKKRKLCHVLLDYLASRKLGAASDLILEKGHEHKDSESMFSHLLELGKVAGGVASLKILEGLVELKAGYLERHLTASVLKRTPKELQPAVENLNADGDFRPTMYHSARRIHMF